jgi:hypothetical protein
MEEIEGECPLGSQCERVVTDEKTKKQTLVRCPWHQKIHGVHPSTGVTVDNYACAIALLPMLLINNANEVRQGAAASESFRNEIVKNQIPFLQQPPRMKEVSSNGEDRQIELPDLER